MRNTEHIIKIVAPNFHTIVHEIGCIPHKASTVSVAPVKTMIVARMPTIALMMFLL